MDCVITIDIGTSALRIFAFEMSGTIIGSLKASIPTFHTQPDYSEQDPEQIFVTLLNLLKNLLAEKIHPRKYNIAAICFSAAMHSMLPIDIHGIPLGNAMVWSDNRAKKQSEELKKMSFAAKIYHATGTPIHPMSPLVKISWLRIHDQERFKQTYKFVSIKEYILQQLTGEYLIDHSIASATGLFNIHTLQWDADALAFSGITPERLSFPVPVYYSQLAIKKEYRTTLGLAPKTKIIIGASDGCLATLGAGAWGEGKATITIDSSGAVRIADKKVLHDEKQRFFNYLLAEGYYVSGGPTNNGGVVFEWFARQFGMFNDAIDFEESLTELFHEASQVGAGAEGLLFLPYLLGERAPIWNANARGMYFGININHQQKHFVRATVEGILYEIYSIGKILEEHRTIDSLYINGSFASEPLWSQIIADMFDKPVNVNDNHDSIGIGAFLLSLTEMGIYGNLEEAVRTISFPHLFLPNTNDHKTYIKYFNVFEKLSGKLADEFEQIALLQQL